MEKLHEIHKRWKYQEHEFSHFKIMPLNAESARVRAVGTVYWETRDAEKLAISVLEIYRGES